MTRHSPWALAASTALLATACEIPRHNEAPLAVQQAASIPQGSRVWVNAASGVYHCRNSRFYGATQDGEYMSERAAMQAGYRPAGDAGCNDARDGVKVRVNSASSTYHCPHTRWYGKTASGEYMPEAEARAKGFDPANGSACGG
jgi:hypothetical protein